MKLKTPFYRPILKNYKRVLFISLFTIVITLFFFLNFEKGRYELHHSEQYTNLNYVESENLKEDTLNHVSIAKFSNHQYVFANYLNMFLLNSQDGTVYTLKVRDLKKVPQLGAIPYNPTGVAFDNQNNIYIANYKGNNILKGKINLNNAEIYITDSYYSSNTLGPENVAVDQQNNILISANYDAGTLTAFKLDTHEPLWVANIPQAHGVCISDDSVYATGLVDRKLFKLNLHDGKMIISKGTIGWEPMKNEFLWPTSIYSLDDQTLIVTDAHTGFISIVDKLTLKVIQYTGGNGPTYKMFNYPYAAVPIDNDIVILSTKRGNILFVDKYKNNITHNFVSFSNNWHKEARQSRYFGKNWDLYVDGSNESVSVRGNSYKLGFGNLHHYKRGTVLRIPNVDTLYNVSLGAWYMYFLEKLSPTNDISFIFSSSAETLLAIVSHPEMPDLLLHKKIHIDSWVHKNDIITSDGIVSSQSLHIEFKAIADHAYDILSTQGWLSPQDLYSIYNSSEQIKKLSFDEFQEYLNKAFTSPIGNHFKLIYNKCSRNECNLLILRRAARDYYRLSDYYNYLDLDEYLLVGMLSGEKDEKKNIK